MIACQGDNGGGPFATSKLLDDAHRAKTAVDVVAQEHSDGIVERSIFRCRS